MTKTHVPGEFLFHYLPPAGTGSSLLVLGDETGSRPITVAELCMRPAPVSTYSPHLVIEHCMANAGSFPPLRDVSAAVRLVVGRPRRSFGRQPLPWDMAEALACSAESPGDRMKVARIVHGLPTCGGGAEPAIADFVMASLRAIWQRTLVELRTEGELQRFLTVEDPVSRVLHRTQSRGLAIDRSALLLAFERTDSAYYRALRHLQIDMGVDVESVRAQADRLLELVRAESPVELDDWPGHLSSREIARHLHEMSPVCARLHELWKLNDERRILTDLGGGMHSRVFPLFDLVGTVTARVTVRDPHLQSLTKRLRHLLVADPGRRLIYVDYQYFEPMIMAALADCPELQTICRDDDIYLFIARRAGHEGRRKVFKVLFLGYSYGMGKESLGRWAARLLGIDRTAADSVVQTIINTLMEVSDWKSIVYVAISRDGRVGTAMGNFRRRETTGELSASELRWSISQVIQGTGSLILKRALLAIDCELGAQVSLLLPLHDAGLFEVDENAPIALERRIVELFEAAAREVLPTSHPRASIQKFVTGD